MDPTSIFWFIYSLYLASFLWNFYLTLRQYFFYRKSETRPEEVSEIISKEDFVKARDYNLDKMHFGFYEIAFGKTLATIFQSVLFILLSSVFETVVELPFSYYETFYVEQKHGFNKELMMFIYPEFIAPLFDKYTPLPESELKTKIEALANQVEFPLKKLYVVEGSKRSSHSNAYMYGFWKNKRIVLYDTLLSEEMNKKLKQADQKGTETETTTESQNDTETTKPETSKGETSSKTPEKTSDGESSLRTTSSATTSDGQHKRSLGMADDEIVAVLGHELGHWREYHSMWLLISTESRDNLSLPINDWLYSACNHSHPPILERIEALKKFK
uniref:CAAX prenyl protease n=1 Tax=Meloidogyne hapla TaxID=6305 RepID=A0A1I8B933_MELHA